MNLKKFSTSLLGLMAIIIIDQTQAKELRVVPGSSVAYLYFPSSAGTTGKSKLTLEKKGAFKNYVVTYQKDGGSEEILCPIGDDSCETSLPAGTVTLAISGHYGNNKYKIAGGNWSGDCAGTGQATCKLAIVAGAEQIVRITTGCDGSSYSVITVGSGTKPNALCVSESHGMDGDMLIAAHKNVGDTGYKTKIAKGTVGNTDNQDGRINMTKLLTARNSTSSTSSAHYCQGLSVDGQSGWYLPAQYELMQINSLTQPTEISDRYFYTSTETDKKYTGVVFFKTGSNPTYITEKHKSGSCEKPGKYSKSCSYNLCMARIVP